MFKFGTLFADILIVDHTPDLVQAVRSVLQAAGYTVRSADSGASALESVSAQLPDLILLEIKLPDEDGHHLIRHIKANAELPFIPVIGMAASPTQEEITAALNAGADEFIHKPVDNAELLTRVRAMLRLKATTDQLADLNATLEQKVIERTRELEQAQASLRHTEKLSALGRMAASIAHEINNPLGAILLHLYLIQKALPTDSPILQDLDVIQNQVESIGRLVEQLRSFSKPPRQDRRPVSLNEVLEGVLTLTGKDLQKHNIRIETDLDPTLPAIVASPNQLEEVFLNMVINARDAMPDGGALTIATAANGQYIQARVADTGTGIPSDVVDRIFEPFFTTKGEEGTGLGLAISHSIVEDHGGAIRVESQPQQGTTFIIQFPRQEAEQS